MFCYFEFIRMMLARLLASLRAKKINKIEFFAGGNEFNSNNNLVR